MALVPNISCPYPVLPEDVFYARLVDFHLNYCESKVLLMEVGDDPQAVRVVKILMESLRTSTGGLRNSIEIWRDWPDATPHEDEAQALVIQGEVVPVRGSGRLRAAVSMAKDLQLKH